MFHLNLGVFLHLNDLSKSMVILIYAWYSFTTHTGYAQISFKEICPFLRFLYMFEKQRYRERGKQRLSIHCLTSPVVIVVRLDKTRARNFIWVSHMGVRDTWIIFPRSVKPVAELHQKWNSMGCWCNCQQVGHYAKVPVPVLFRPFIYSSSNVHSEFGHALLNHTQIHTHKF